MSYVNVIGEKILKCDGFSTCGGSVTHIDDKGFVYCTMHGQRRQMYYRCRKIKPAETKRLKSGQPLERY